MINDDCEDEDDGQIWYEAFFEKKMESNSLFAKMLSLVRTLLAHFLRIDLGSQDLEYSDLPNFAQKALKMLQKENFSIFLKNLLLVYGGNDLTWKLK